MESVAIVVGALGAVFLVALGAITLLFGATADVAEDFPFRRIAWLRPVTAASLVAVGQSFFVLLAEPAPAAAVFLVFVSAAGYIAVAWFRERARSP
jgi:hypothetical protein